MPFTFQQLDLEGLVVVEPRIFEDPRGRFFESFKASDFAKIGVRGPIVQVNESTSSRGVIRGLHYQIHPHAQGKLVRVSRGAVQDVAVDLRRDSPTFGRHVSVVLDERDQRALWIPPGFAHGAAALEDDTTLVYLVTGGEYDRESERGVHPYDPELGIDWQIPEADRLLSDRDATLPPLAAADLRFG